MHTVDGYRRKILGGMAASGLASTMPARVGAQAPKRPNVIVFLSDDHRWDAVGYEGHPFTQTPNLDALAARGVAFRNAYVTTPICATSRASIFTGTHLVTHGFNFGSAGIPTRFRRSMFPVVMRDAGYHTALFGKLGVWFDDGIFPAAMRRLGLAPLDGGIFDEYEEISRRPYISPDDDGVPRHSLDKIERRALNFLDRQSSDTPFLLFVSFNAPHATLAENGTTGYPPAPAEADLFKDRDLPKRELADPALHEALPTVIGRHRSETLLHAPGDPSLQHPALLDYHRLVAGLDRVMGSILSKLETREMAENTVVLFASDNGFLFGERGISGKWNHFEESIRIPMVLYDPRNRAMAGSRPSQFALNIDIPSTVLDVAGLEAPRSYQGRSLAPFLDTDAPENWRRDFYCEHRDFIPNRKLPDWIGLRTEAASFAEYDDEDQSVYMLHDMIGDPQQIENLAHDPAWRGELTRLRDETHRLHNLYRDWPV